MSVKESAERTLNRLPLELGSTVEGRYELISVLGVGGFGVVYKARQKTTGQLVALKVLRGQNIEREGSVEMARFEREMKLIGRIKHPHIVRLIDFGRLDGGLLYMVIEYVDGETLSALLQREGGLRPREAKRFMSQILFALHAVHEHGVVYRDLKPANIMISTNGSHRDATILDFGISGLSDGQERGGDIQDLTVDGSIRGTPAYMAPELLKAQLATPQSDIYAWGLVFMETLMSRRVIRADSSVEVMAKQISPDEVPIPQEILETACGPIIQKAVAKNMAQRWKTTAELIEYFEECEMNASFHLPWTGLPAMQALKQAASRPSLSTGDIASATFGTDDIDSSLLIPLDEPKTGDKQAGKSALPVAMAIAGVLLMILILGLILLKGESAPPDPSQPAAAVAPAAVVPAAVAPAAVAPAAVAPTAVAAPAVPALVLDVKSRPESAKFVLDGNNAGIGQLRREMDGKKHVLRIEADGYAPASVEFTDRPPSGVIELQKLPGAKASDAVAARAVVRSKASAKAAPTPAAPPLVDPEAVAEESALIEPAPEEVAPAEPPKRKREKKKKKASATEKLADEFAPVLKVTPDPWAEKKADDTPDPWSQ